MQGHIGSTWQGGQYVRSRDLKQVIPAFEDILRRMKTDYIDLGTTASACIGCQSCESRCLFGVEIAARMSRTADLFGH